MRVAFSASDAWRPNVSIDGRVVALPVAGSR